MRKAKYYSVTVKLPSGKHAAVFGHLGEPCPTLTEFAQISQRHITLSSSKVYLAHLLRFANWLVESENLDVGALRPLPKQRLRQLVENFLRESFSCRIRDGLGGRKLVVSRASNQPGVSTALAALKLFFRLGYKQAWVRSDNPLGLVTIGSDQKTAISDYECIPSSIGSMPQKSGVVPPPVKRHTLTASYLVVQGKDWVPQILDDDDFPSRIYSAGESYGWNLRDRLVTRLLFESGARVSEICSLTISDWSISEYRTEASCKNKGSGNVREKWIRFSHQTERLMTKYIKQERASLCNQDGSHHYNFLKTLPSEAAKITPIFITRQKTGLTADTYRSTTWYPLCRRAGIKARVHQIRHWYVTRAINLIYRSKLSETERERRIQHLIRYMGWRSGKKTMEAYEHFFNAREHHELQDELHRVLNAVHSRPVEAQIEKPSNSTAGLHSDTEWDYLMKLAGE